MVAENSRNLHFLDFDVFRSDLNFILQTYHKNYRGQHHNTEYMKSSDDGQESNLQYILIGIKQIPSIPEAQQKDYYRTAMQDQSVMR